jgi:hypothetical protein
MIREEPYFRDRPFFYNHIGIDNEMQKKLYYHIQNLVYIFCRQEVLKEDNNAKSKLAFYLAWHIFMQNYETKMYIKNHKEYIIKEAHENIKKIKI